MISIDLPSCVALICLNWFDGKTELRSLACSSSPVSSITSPSVSLSASPSGEFRSSPELECGGEEGGRDEGFVLFGLSFRRLCSSGGEREERETGDMLDKY